MGLRIFSVLGEALNFGARRMETTARVSWLPLVLSQIAAMAAVFAFLSVITGQTITFANVPSFLVAQQALAQNAATGFERDPQAMWIIISISVIVQMLLTASFMAPLIRYAGLGEKPAPGFIRAPFGADQLRYVISSVFALLFVAILVFGPVAAASFYTLKYIAEALRQTMAVFPDPESLHTIEIKTSAEVIAEQGRSWIYSHALPLSGAAPVGVAFWMLLFFHFSPHNRPGAVGPNNFFLRAIATFFVAALMFLIAYAVLGELVLSEFRGNLNFIGMLASLGSVATIDFSTLGDSLAFLVTSPAGRLVFFGVASFFVMNYFSLRLFPYSGVAVCRKSLGLGHTLAVSRGWNIIRLWVIVTVIGVFLFVVQVYILNVIVLQKLLPQVLNLLFNATAVTTRLLNSGVTSDWVLPFFIWVWNFTKIAVNFFWSFFSFGVTAGLYGRLYRESEAGQ